MLTIRDTLPEGLLECRARDIGSMLDGPTLIELPGERPEPLFVSILIHGNEDVGLGAIQLVLRAYRGKALPRALMLYVGNVTAASKGLRRLDGQPDFNRVWPGAVENAGSAQAAMMAQVHQRVINRGAFAAIDLHNNTGRNPFYSVVCTRDPSVLGLAALFTERAVLFRGLPGTQTASFAGKVPAMTAECGKPGSADNEQEVADFLERVFALELLPDAPAHPEALQLFHTLGVVRVKPNIDFGFGDADRTLNFDPQLDHLNFEALPPGTRLGSSQHAAPLAVIDEDGADVARRYFAVEGDALTLKATVTPAMLTVDERVVRQDCLGYLMEPIGHL